jgi:hypothetical protein
MGCTPEELNIAPERTEQWSDVPPVSQDLYGARDAIKAHIETLVMELQSANTG